MKQKQVEAFRNAFAQPSNKSLAPEQSAEIDRILAEWHANPQAFSMISFVGSGNLSFEMLASRKQKLSWFIAGIGVGLALAWAALMIGILWVV